MVLNNYDSNDILASPLKNKLAIHQLWSTQALHEYLNERGLNPKMQVMDNECPNNVKKYLRDNNIAFQFVPLHSHRTNAAEKAISMF